MSDQKETRLDRFTIRLKNSPLAIIWYSIIGLSGFLAALVGILASAHSLGLGQISRFIEDQIVSVWYAEGKAVAHAGIEVASGDASLESDRKTIKASVRITNRNAADVLVMAVGEESAFVVADMPNRAPVDVSGLAFCKGNSGVLPTTSLCRNDSDSSRWSKLGADETYAVQLSSNLDRPVEAKLASINLRLLLRSDGKTEPYDFDIKDLGIHADGAN